MTGAVWQWLRGNPRLAALLTVVALAAAGLLAMRALRDPGLPEIVVEGAPDSSPAADPWQSGWDGRPQRPVILSVTASVRMMRPQKGLLSVAGIAGPGIVHTESSPVAVPEEGSVKVPLRADVDCSRVPLTVPTNAFGLRITTGDGPRGHTGVVPAGQPGHGWAHAVQMACATWTARRYLTVSTLRARVHPRLPRADLTVTFVNNGPRTAVVDTPSIRLSRRGCPRPVPGAGSATGLRDCARHADVGPLRRGRQPGLQRDRVTNHKQPDQPGGNCRALPRRESSRSKVQARGPSRPVSCSLRRPARRWAPR